MTSLEAIEDLLLGSNCGLDRISAELAKMFHVGRTEVGILRLEDGMLRFLYPAELQSAGRIPISSSAVAARTAATKKAELYNNFASISHHTVFELVKLKDPEQKNEGSQRIQKLMSTPILGARDQVLGVVQVSRKGLSPGAAGPDFTREDLQKLERTARRVAILRPGILLCDVKKPSWKLELQNEQKKKTEAARGH